MTTPPACRSMGRHCHAVTVTVRVGETDDHEAYFDAVATWLLAHTERIEFGELYEDDEEEDILVDATIHVPCRYLQRHGSRAACAAHGYRTDAGKWPVYTPVSRQLGGDMMELSVDAGLEPVRVTTPRRALQVLPSGENPCATARCHTSDNKRGAACCRDLILEIELPERARHREALLRSRRTPYACEFNRTDEDTVELHVISACSFLDTDGVSCVLHGKYRPNRRVAKPFLCTRWPDDPKNTHRGCVFAVEGD